MKTKIHNLIAMNVNVDDLRRQRTELLQMETADDHEGVETIEGIVNMIDAMLDSHDKVGSPPLDTLALKHHGLISEDEAAELMEGGDMLPEPLCDALARQEIHDEQMKKEEDWARKMAEHEKKPAPPLDAYMHEPGAKDDETKPMSALVLGGFSGALEEVVKVGTFGAEKYSPNGWMHVPNAHDRYQNAAMRHWLTSMNGNRFNHEDGGVRHLAQVIWNLMSVLEFELAEEQMQAVKSEFGEPG